MKRPIEILATMLGIAIMFTIVFVKAGSQTTGGASQSGGAQTAKMVDAFGSAGSSVISSIEGG